MLEWLAKDPLNGIVITLSFFISIIIGRILREKRNLYPGKIFEARIKLFFAFILIILITMMQHWYFPIIISVICLVISMKLTSLRDYAEKLLFPFVLGIFIFSVEGIASGFLIFSRVIASASVLIILLLSTSQDDILKSMRWFGVPATILDISWFMKRYIQSLAGEGKRLKMAQESRCGFSRNSGFVHKMQNVAAISGLLIIHAFKKSDRIYNAMLSRCWMPGSHFRTEQLDDVRKE